MTDLGSQAGTWLNGKRLQARMQQRLRPDDTVSFGEPGRGSLDFKVCMHHKSLLENGGRHGSYDRRNSVASMASGSIDLPEAALSSK